MDVSDIETEAEKGETAKKGWLSRLRSGLAKSTKKVAESITGLFTKKKLDQQTLDELEDALIQADLGVTVAARLVEKLGKERFGKGVTDEEVRAAFADDIPEILRPRATRLAADRARKPSAGLAEGRTGKVDAGGPHACLLGLGGTTGQNAHGQVEAFKALAAVDALVVTKLDGSAKGGVLVALAEKFGLPVVAVGVGEGIDDLRPFEAQAFARGLMGLPA